MKKKGEKMENCKGRRKRQIKRGMKKQKKIRKQKIKNRKEIEQEKQRKIKGSVKANGKK